MFPIGDDWLAVLFGMAAAVISLVISAKHRLMMRVYLVAAVRGALAAYLAYLAMSAYWPESAKHAVRLWCGLAGFLSESLFTGLLVWGRGFGTDPGGFLSTWMATGRMRRGVGDEDDSEITGISHRE